MVAQRLDGGKRAIRCEISVMDGKESFGVGIEKWLSQRRSAMKDTFSALFGMTNACRLLLCSTESMGEPDIGLGIRNLSRARAVRRVAVRQLGDRCNSGGGSA